MKWSLNSIADLVARLLSGPDTVALQAPGEVDGGVTPEHLWREFQSMTYPGECERSSPIVAGIQLSTLAERSRSIFATRFASDTVETSRVVALLDQYERVVPALSGRCRAYFAMGREVARRLVADHPSQRRQRHGG